MAGEISRFLATLLLVIFCALGVALLAEAAALTGGWHHRLAWSYWQSRIVGAGLIALLNIAVAVR